MEQSSKTKRQKNTPAVTDGGSPATEETGQHSGAGWEWGRNNKEAAGKNLLLIEVFNDKHDISAADTNA